MSSQCIKRCYLALLFSVFRLGLPLPGGTTALTGVRYVWVHTRLMRFPYPTKLSLMSNVGDSSLRRSFVLWCGHSIYPYHKDKGVSSRTDLINEAPATRGKLCIYKDYAKLADGKHKNSYGQRRNGKTRGSIEQLFTRLY